MATQPGSQSCAVFSGTSHSQDQGAQGGQGEQGDQTYDEWADRIRKSSRIADLQGMQGHFSKDCAGNGNACNAASPSTGPSSILRGANSHTQSPRSPNSARSVSFDSSAQASPPGGGGYVLRGQAGGQPVAAAPYWSADDDAALRRGAAVTARHSGLQPPTHGAMLSLVRLRTEGLRPGPYDDRC